MARRPGLLAKLSLRAIHAYQRFLSPRKGYSCAFRCATGRDGCSGYGYRVIQRFGLIAGLALLRRRLRLCGDTYRRRTTVPNPVLYYQRGDCDPGCGGDCLPDLSGNNICNPCDVCNCSGGDCGNPRRAWNDWRTRRQLRKWQANVLR